MHTVLLRLGNTILTTKHVGSSCGIDGSHRQTGINDADPRSPAWRHVQSAKQLLEGSFQTPYSYRAQICVRLSKGSKANLYLDWTILG
jgi:hypothetical protein